MLDLVGVLNIYGWIWLLCVSVHPQFLPVNYKRPWAISRDNAVV